MLKRRKPKFTWAQVEWRLRKIVEQLDELTERIPKSNRTIFAEETIESLHGVLQEATIAWRKAAKLKKRVKGS